MRCVPPTTVGCPVACPFIHGRATRIWTHHCRCMLATAHGAQPPWQPCSIPKVTDNVPRHCSSTLGRQCISESASVAENCVMPLSCRCLMLQNPAAFLSNAHAPDLQVTACLRSGGSAIGNTVQGGHGASYRSCGSQNSPKAYNPCVSNSEQ